MISVIERERADVTSRYDLAGRRTFARFGSSLTPSNDCTATGNTGIDYCYDTVGRLQYETSYGRKLAFQYDAASNRTRLTFAADSNYFAYDYDSLNRVTHVRENGASSGAGVLAAYTYDPMSRRLSLMRGNGAGTLYEYSDASRLTLLNHDLSGTTNDANWAFAYTDVGQLESRSWIQAYEWPVAALDEDYERNGLNQYTEVDSAAFNYDSRGNLISDGSRNFSYDFENRLLTASGAVSGTLVYDPLGRLRSYTTGGTTTEFLYDGGRLVAEYVSGNVARRYTHGPGVDEPLVWYEGSGLTTPRWLIADRQGSIVATTDASGAATIYRYGPYGEPDSWSGPRFRYTGQAVLAELHLYHYKARAYDPLLGRFLQTDPVGYEDDLNLYAYVRNDPLNATDPTGRQGRHPDDTSATRAEDRRREALENLPGPTQLDVPTGLAEGTYTLTGSATAVASTGSLGLGRPVGIGGGGSLEGGVYYYNAPEGEADSFGLIGEGSIRVGREVGASVNLGFEPDAPTSGREFTVTGGAGLVSVTGEVTNGGDQVRLDSLQGEVRRVGGGERYGASTGPVWRGVLPLWTEPAEKDLEAR